MAAGEAPRLYVLMMTDEEPLADEARWGFPSNVTVEVVGDAGAARASVEKRRPDVLVLDLQSGNSGGVALLKDLADDARTAAIPSLMLLDRPHDGWLVTEAGASKWLRKPLEVTSLVDATLALVAEAGAK